MRTVKMTGPLSDSDVSSMDPEDVEARKAIQYSHEEPGYYLEGDYYNNHVSSRTHEEVDAAKTGHSVKAEGLSIREPMSGQGWNDIHPFRSSRRRY